MRVYLPSGKPIGEIREGTFYRSFRGSLHLLQRPVPALAIDAKVYTRYRPYFHELLWRDSESGREFRISAKTFEQRAFTLERGFGKQLACPLRYWAVHYPNAKQEQLALAL